MLIEYRIEIRKKCNLIYVVLLNTDINLLVEIPVPPHRGSQEAGGRGDVVFSRSGSPRNIC